VSAGGLHPVCAAVDGRAREVSDDWLPSAVDGLAADQRLLFRGAACLCALNFGGADLVVAEAADHTGAGYLRGLAADLRLTIREIEALTKGAA
jgi:hypothetical protein